VLPTTATLALMARNHIAWIAGATGSAMLLVAGGLAVTPGATAALQLSGADAVIWLLDAAAVTWVGALITAHRAGNAVGPVLLAGGLLVALLQLLTFSASYATVGDRSPHAGAWALVASEVVWPPAYFCIYCLLPLLFPDGRFMSERWRSLALGMAALTVVPVVLAPLYPRLSLGFGSHMVPNPIGILPAAPLDRIKSTWQLLFSAGTLSAIASLVVRYRRSGAEQRRQVRWVAAAAGLLLAVLAEQQTGQVIVPSIALPFTAVLVAAGGLAVAIGVALLRGRLFDIDLVIRRSLVYGVLWLAIAGLYGGLAAAFGLAAGQRVSIEAAVLVTIAVTLVFQPVRAQLERLADRLAYGRRASAYELLRDFGAATERTLDVAEIGPRLADAARIGLGARWAQVLVYDPTGGPGVVLGSSGDVVGPPTLTAPLTRGTLDAGWIECGPRADGAFRGRDRELLVTLGGQAALAIQNASLISELAGRVDAMDRQARELAASRARIVQAQEEERRRIERDLHDGIQQQLISLVAGVRLARNRIESDPRGADAALIEVQRQALEAQKDLRQLARGIHPALLVDAGLVPAVEAAVTRLPLRVTIEADTSAAGRHGTEVESAAYFVICEALVNVMKHADVSEARVVIQRSSGLLRVSVCDRGRGVSPGADRGSGLTGLRDRIAAVGGDLRIDSGPGVGTTVTATLAVSDDG